MNNTHFIKEDNSIYLVGNLDVDYISYDVKNIDGEVYTRTIKEKKHIVLEKTKNLYCTFSFKELDLKYNIYVQKSEFLDSYIEIYLRYKLIYSENIIVNLIHHLHDLNLLDERIKNIYTSKEIDGNYKITNNYKSFVNFIKNSTVNFSMFRYGHNNFINYSVSWETMLSIKKEYVPYIHEKLKFNSHQNLIDKAMRILKLKLTHYNNN